LVIVRDGIKPNAVSLEFWVGVAQLTELRPARGSPDSGSIKNDDGLMAIPVSMELDGAAAGVRQSEVRKGLANFGACGVARGQSQPCRMPERRRGIESVFVSFRRHSVIPAVSRAL
jgi:hypothetical protein